MSEYPSSPDDIIDPRWGSYLRPRTPTRPAQPAHAMPSDELEAELRVIVGRWQSGAEGVYETLEALRDLAERAL